jgi:hemolysin type calcium-binding protein
MQISLRRSGRGLALAACAAALVAAPAASAKPVTAEVRVEAGKPMVPGYSYVTDTARLKTDPSPACGGSGATKTIQGPSALGLVASAERIVKPLRPFAVSDKFDFGLFVCGIGSSVGASDGSSFWLYKVDHKSPSVGGEQFPLKGGEQVLWYFVDPARGINSGTAPDFSAKELVLVAPARARSGKPFGVRVLQYEAEGRRSPAAGVRVLGGTTERTDASGRTEVVSGKHGYLGLRAVRDGDVPAAPVNVCLNPKLSRCPRARGERIFGTNGADRLRGTRGADVVTARGGTDRIDVRGGGRDRVRCGSGRDRVRLGHSDRAARDCERVLR